MKDIEETSSDSKKEVANGFFETRRRMFWMPASLAGCAILGTAERVIANQLNKDPSMSGPMASAGNYLDWESFLKQCLPVAGELYKDSSAPGQEAYLHWLGSMISRVRTNNIPRAKKVGRFEKLEPAVTFGVSYRGQPFFIVEWELEPRAFLPPHCHPNASVCTVGLDGEAQIRNFEIIGQAPEFSSRKTFLVRQTHNEVVAAGRINTLSSTRDNIHTFQAGKAGARGIDISTLHGPDVGFSFLEIGGKPRDPEAGTYEAAWKGQSV